MDAEHLYHWLRGSLDTNPKTTWEKSELLEKLKQLYLEVLEQEKKREKKDRRTVAR